MPVPALRQTLLSPTFLIGVAFVAFQAWILLTPQQPLFERPVHLTLPWSCCFSPSPSTPRPCRSGPGAQSTRC